MPCKAASTRCGFSVRWIACYLRFGVVSTHFKSHAIVVKNFMENLFLLRKNLICQNYHECENIFLYLLHTCTLSCLTNLNLNSIFDMPHESETCSRLKNCLRIAWKDLFMSHGMFRFTFYHMKFAPCRRSLIIVILYNFCSHGVIWIVSVWKLFQNIPCSPTQDK